MTAKRLGQEVLDLGYADADYDECDHVNQGFCDRCIDEGAAQVSGGTP